MRTRRASADDLVRCADVLGQAFADYPWTRWTVEADDHRRRVTALQRLALEHYGLPFGQVWVTEVDASIECVAVWMDSSVVVPPAPSDLVERLEGGRHDASVAAERQIADWRPSERHYYLGAVGTTPARQRRGLATFTLAPVLAAADEEGVPAFLETSSETNVSFYERLGFQIADHRRIDGGGPDVWAMLRPVA